MENLAQLVEELRELTEKGSPASFQTKTSPILIPIPKLKKKPGDHAGASTSEPTKAGKGQGTNVAKAGEKRKRKAGTFVKTTQGDWEKVPEKGTAVTKKPQDAPAATKAVAKKAAANKPQAKKSDGQVKVKKVGGKTAKAAAKVKQKDPKAANDAAKALKKAAKGKKPSPEEKKGLSKVAGGIAASIARTFLKGFYRGRDIGTGKIKDKVKDFAKRAWEKFLKKIDFVESFQVNGQLLLEEGSDEADLMHAVQAADSEDAVLAVIADFMKKQIRSEIEDDPEMDQGTPGWDDDDAGDDDGYPFERNPSLNPND